MYTVELAGDWGAYIKRVAARRAIIIAQQSNNFTSDNRTYWVTSPLSDGPVFFSYILLLS